MKSKKKWLLIVGLEVASVFIFILFHLVVHKPVDLPLTFSDVNAEASENAVLEDHSYSYCYEYTICEALPEGSYTLSLQINQAADDMAIALKDSDESLESLWSNTVSFALSPYADTYSFAFSSNTDKNTIFLELYCELSPEELSSSGFELVQGQIKSTGLMLLQQSILLILLFLLIDSLLLIFAYGDRRKWLWLFGIAVVSSFPLFFDAVYYGHDTLFHLARIDGIKAGLLSGQFPVRLSPVQYNGYGYISSALYPELLLYFPAFLRLLGISMVNCYRLFWFSINLLTAFIAWHSFGGVLQSRNAAFAGSLLWTALPFRLISIFLRGAFGEALALTFYPLIFWGLYEIFLGDRRRWPLAMLGYTGVLQCHILSTVSVLLAGIAAGLLCLPHFLREKKRFLSVFALAISTFLLNMWFVVPFIFLYRLPLWVKYMNTDFASHVLYVFQLLNPLPWGTGASQPLSEGTAGEMPFSIGAGLMVGLVLIIICIYKNRKTKDSLWRFCLTAAIASLVVYWTTTVWFPWQLISKALPAFTAFASNLPWRKCGLGALFLTAAACAAYITVPARKAKAAAGFLCFGVLFSASVFSVSYVALNDRIVETDADLYSGGEDGLYLYLGTDTQALEERGASVTIESSSIDLADYEKKYSCVRFHYANSAENDQWVELPLNYYPGYTAITDDGENLTVTESENHVLRVILKANSSGYLTVRYENGTMYQICTAISIGFAACWIAFGLYRRHSKTGKIRIPA